jgi:hypothetical protein
MASKTRVSGVSPVVVVPFQTNATVTESLVRAGQYTNARTPLRVVKKRGVGPKLKIRQ